MSGAGLETETAPAFPPAPAHAPAGPTRVLKPPSGRALEALRATWQRRMLVGFFARYALGKLYARTFLGRVWVLLRPGLDATLRIVVLGSLLNPATPGVPYGLFAAVGLTAWQLFEIGGYWATRSMELNRRTLRRTAFPRLPVLVGSIAPGGLYALIYAIGTTVLLVGFSIADHHIYLKIGPHSLEALVGMAMIALLSISMGLWLAPLAVRYRDVRFAFQHLAGLWFFITPVIYPITQPHGALHTAAELNPITAPVQFVQNGILGTGAPSAVSLLSSVAFIGVLLAGGLVRFVRAELRAFDAV